tara:strand:- start:1094 stop:1267 length:174 start_codon:yes stop_codon:yes gene_type:complete
MVVGGFSSTHLVVVVGGNLTTAHFGSGSRLIPYYAASWNGATQTTVGKGSFLRTYDE